MLIYAFIQQTSTACLTVPQGFQFLKEGGAQQMIMHIMLNRAQDAVAEKGHAEWLGYGGRVAGKELHPEKQTQDIWEDMTARGFEPESLSCDWG